MAYPVFNAFALAAHASIFCGLQNSQAVIGMDLLHRRSGLKVFRGISEYLFIGRTVVEAVAITVDERDHIGRVFADQLKQLIPLSQLASNAVKLHVLVDGIEIEN